MNALSVAGQAGLDNWRGVNSNAVYLNDYSYRGRAKRYDIYEQWYRNVMFNDLNAYAQILRQRNHLYKHIREIYNPVKRLADIETSKTYGGQIDWTGGLRVGAIPVVGADKALIDAIITIFKWSNMGMMKDPYVRAGSKKGDRFIKIVDDSTRGRVRMELLDPYYVHDCDFDDVGNIKFIVIQYYMYDFDQKKDYLYREEIDRESFRFWKEFHLNAFDNGVKRAPDLEYPNPYGFVPVKHSPHVKEDDTPWGHVSYASTLGKIVEVNDQASLGHDSARKALNPIYVSIGGRIPEADNASRERDEIIVLNVPKDGKVETITPQVDMVGIFGNIDRLLQEIENDMPALKLQGISGKGAGSLSGTAIENMYSDSADALIGIQGNCDEGMISATKMAISIAAYRGYEAFRKYDPIKSFERGDLDFYIKQRDVFIDRVPTERRIQLLNESSDKVTLPIVARDLEYSEEDIALMMADKAERESAQAAAAIRGLAQGFGMDGGDEEEIEEEGMVDESSAVG